MWTETASRLDPVTLLESQAPSRLQELLPIRYGRMYVSPFAFLRGSAIVMANDLAGTATTGILTQLCGDCHLSNFGLYASPERSLVFDINDFDETHPGPWEWDVKRLVASCVVAARNNGMSQAACREVALSAAGAYRSHMAQFASMGELDVWYTRVTAEDLLRLISNQSSRKRMANALVKVRQRDSLQALSKLTKVVNGERVIVENPPLVTRITSPEEVGQLDTLVATYVQTMRGAQRRLLERFQIVDVAQKVVGVGSVGTRCYILLLMGRNSGAPLFLQVKEAQPSVLQAYMSGESAFENQGERVVSGQILMQAASDIFLGWLRNQYGQDFYVRQLRDMKGTVDIEALSPSELNLWAEFCGWATARAHARAGSAVEIAAYLGASDTFDQAIATFAEAYADQTERDWRAFRSAVKTGRIAAALAN